LRVDDKVTEAQFFLRKLESISPTDEDSVHYLSAFLSSSRSIMRQLLCDSAKEFQLGFSDDALVDGRSFRARALADGNADALRFADSFDESMERLGRNGFYQVLALRREINVRHGTHALVHNLSIMTQERIDETDSLRVRIERDPPIAIGPNVFHPVTPEPEKGTSNDFQFEDFPGEPVRHVCSVYLKAILDEVATLRAEQ
jgi:hypothetical protein